MTIATPEEYLADERVDSLIADTRRFRGRRRGGPRQVARVITALAARPHINERYVFTGTTAAALDIPVRLRPYVLTEAAALLEGAS